MLSLSLLTTATETSSPAVPTMAEVEQTAAYAAAVQWAQKANKQAAEPVAREVQTSDGSSECSKCQVSDLLSQRAAAVISQSNLQDNGSVSLEASGEKIYVFVSFSMPLATLKALAQEAEKHQAVLVMRGLINDSYKDTAAQLADFPTGIEINPQLFKDYRIERVPTFVLVRQQQEVRRLAGNVTLGFAVEKLQEVH